MTILLNPAEPVRFVAPGQEKTPEAERIVYLLKAPTVWDRIAHERALSERGIRRHTVLDLLTRARHVAGKALEARPGSARQSVLQGLDDYEAALRKLAASGHLPEKAQMAAVDALLQIETAMAGVFDLIAHHDPVFATMRADNLVYAEASGIAAAQRFLTGWQNLPLAFSATAEGIDPALLLRLPREHVIAIGREVERLLLPSETERKNSFSPSSGGNGRTGSTAGKTPRRTSRSQPTAGT